MKRTLVIGDIHGGLKALKQILKKANITSKDTLIFLGDYTDGWSDTPKVFDFLIELKNNNPCIFIKGNHDVYLLDYLKNKNANPKWLSHGGAITVENYKEVTDKQINNHISFLDNLQLYHLDYENRLFLHAGFSHMRGVENEYFKENLYWDRTLWEMAVGLDIQIETNSVLYPKRLKLYKEIYIGHTPTIHINSSIPTQKANIWNIDTGAAFTGKLSMLDINTKQFWQSESLIELYPNEKGRNI